MNIKNTTLSFLITILFSQTSLSSLDVSSTHPSSDAFRVLTNTTAAKDSFSNKLDAMDASLDPHWQQFFDVSQSTGFLFQQDTRKDAEILLQQLRQHSSRLGQGLFQAHTDEQCPVDLHSPLFSWDPAADAVCEDITLVEQDIAALMHAYREIPPLTEDEEDQFLVRFGNKHKNLIKMSRLVRDLQLEGVAVPRPRGLASASIESFLRQVAPEIFDSWQDLGALYATHQNGDFLHTQEATKTLDLIDTALATAFTHPAAQLITEELHSWFQELQEKEQYLMVRSTGAEDSKELANAGGNASVSYVEPHVKTILASIGTVVRSYFSVSSLQNRLNAGRNPFAEELRFSVTLQELVGESIDSTTSNKIPKSLVLFSNEPLYIGGEAFRVLRINGAYGHGEGVVGNFGIATDTLFLLNSLTHPNQLHIIYDRQHKPERLAPQRDTSTGTVRLSKVRHSEEMAKAPLLNIDEIVRLYQLAIVTEAFFDDSATDMEIVIKEGIIYPVQARPVNRPLQLPTYVDMQAVGKLPLSPMTESVPLEVLVPGISSVITFSSREQLLIATTLEEAERRFVSGLHQAVIVGQPEPANSHPVVNFSALGIPCFYKETTQHVEEALTKMETNQQAFLCVQGALFGLWSGSEADVNDYIHQGYARHPANIALSLDGDTPFKGLRDAVPEDLQTQLTALRHAPTHEQALDILENIAVHPWITRLEEVREALTNEAYTYPDLPQEVFQSLHMLQHLEEAIQTSFEEIKAYFSFPHSEQRLQPLFHIKVLEALLEAPDRRDSSLGQVCVADVALITQRIEEIIDYRKELGQTARLADLLHLGSEAITKEGYQQWRQLLMEFEQAELSHEEETSLRHYLEIMERTRSLPMMMTLSLPQLHHSASSPQEKLNNLLSTLTEADNELVEAARTLNHEINRFAHQLDAFGDPAHFDQAWIELLALNDAMIQPKFLEQYTQASPTGKRLALHSMAKIVDLFDRAIKTVKVSPQWDTDEKVHQIKEMLLPYFKLFQTWTNQLTPHSNIPTNPGWPVKTYLDQLQSLVDTPSSTDAEQLSPSSGFSVAAAVLGSTTRFERHQPQTVEDLFTLIHQNLLMSISILNTDLVANETLEQGNLPQLVKLAIEILQTTTEIRANHIGIDFSDQGIELLYNIALRNHSGQLILKYDKSSDTVSLQLQLLGDARERWSLAEELATLEELAQNAFLNKPIHVNEQEFRASWLINNENALTRTLEIINYMCNEVSMMGAGNLEERYNAVIQGENSEQLPQRVSIYMDSDSPTNRKVAIKIANHLIQSDHQFENAIEFAERGMLDDEWDMRSEAFKLFQTLFEKGDGFKAAEKIAAQGILSNEWAAMSSAIQLFQALIEKDHGFEAAEKAATEGILSDKWPAMSGAIKIFQTLFEKGYGFEAAAKAAAKGALSDDLRVRSSTFELFQTLFEKGYGFEAAEKTATQAALDKDRNLRLDAIKIFQALIKKNHGFEAAEKTATQAALDKDRNLRLEAIKIFQALIEKNHGFETAEKAATQATLDKDRNLRLDAIKLFQALVRKGHGFEAAKKAATQSFLDKDRNLRLEATNLFQNLFEKDLGFETAENIATKGLFDKDRNLHLDAINLFRALFEKNHGFEAAEKAAVQATLDEENAIRSNAFYLFKALVEKNHGLETAEKTATQRIVDSDSTVPSEVLSLFQALIEKDYGFEGAEKAAVQGFLSNDWFLRTSAVNLFQALLEKNHSLEAVEKIAVEGILSDKWDVRLEVFKLFQALFKKDYGFAGAEKAAAQGFLHEDSSVQSDAIKLFQTLFEKDHGFETAEKAAAQGILNEDRSLQANAINLFRALFEKNHGFEAAEKAAAQGILNEDDSLQSNAFYLFEVLVEKNHGLETAEKAATQKVINNDSTLSSDVLSLFQALVEKGLSFEAAEKAATQGFFSDAWFLRTNAINLFQALFEKNHGFEAAEKTAIEGTFDKDSSVQSDAIKLFQTLVKNEYALEAAEKAATQGFLSSDWLLRTSAINLFQALFEKEHGFEAAEKTAVEGTFDKDSSVRSEAIKLFQTLVKNGYALEAAEKAAAQGVLDEDWSVRQSAERLLDALKNVGAK